MTAIDDPEDVIPSHDFSRESFLPKETAEAKRLREILAAYSCILFWMTVSASVVLHNKWLLSEFDFHYPATMTGLHMAFSTIMSHLIIHFNGKIEVPKLDRDQYTKSILPIAFLFSVNLTCTNYSYISLSVAFIQMLKAFLPVLCFCTSVMLGALQWSPGLLAAVVVISIGVFQVSMGEIDFQWTGFILQMTALVVESVRLVLVELLLKAKGINMNPIATLNIIAPITFVCLLGPIIVLEAQYMDKILMMMMQHPGVFLLNCSLAFVLNIAIFLLIGKTSALTMNISGVVKDVFTIGISYLIFHTHSSTRSLLGFGVAIVGCMGYNYKKYQIMQKHAGKQEPPLDTHSEDSIVSDEFSASTLVVRAGANPSG